MFDAGFWEVFLILLLGLVVLGPERLPRVLRMIGLWVGRARASYYSLRTEMERELRIEEMDKARQRMEASLRDVERDADEVERQIRHPADSEPRAAQDEDKHERQ